MALSPREWRLAHSRGSYCLYCSSPSGCKTRAGWQFCPPLACYSSSESYTSYLIFEKQKSLLYLRPDKMFSSPSAAYKESITLLQRSFVNKSFLSVVSRDKKKEKKERKWSSQPKLDFFSCSSRDWDSILIFLLRSMYFFFTNIFFYTTSVYLQRYMHKLLTTRQQHKKETEEETELQFVL